MPRLPDVAFTLAVNVIGASPLVPKRVRRVLLRSFGVRIGRASVCARSFVGSPKLQIGDGTFVNVGVFLDGLGTITVGRNVHLAMGAMVLTGTHEIGGPERRAGALTSADVVIGDGAWIGARATLLPGVTIGRGAVIAAGSVVTGDCEPDSLYAGVPARLVRRLSGEDTPASAEEALGQRQTEAT